MGNSTSQGGLEEQGRPESKAKDHQHHKKVSGQQEINKGSQLTDSGSAFQNDQHNVTSKNTNEKVFSPATLKNAFLSVSPTQPPISRFTEFGEIASNDSSSQPVNRNSLVITNPFLCEEISPPLHQIKSKCSKQENFKDSDPLQNMSPGSSSPIDEGKMYSNVYFPKHHESFGGNAVQIQISQSNSLKETVLASSFQDIELKVDNTMKEDLKQCKNQSTFPDLLPGNNQKERQLRCTSVPILQRSSNDSHKYGCSLGDNNTSLSGTPQKESFMPAVSIQAIKDFSNLRETCITDDSATDENRSTNDTVIDRTISTPKLEPPVINAIILPLEFDTPENSDANRKQPTEQSVTNHDETEIKNHVYLINANTSEIAHHSKSDLLQHTDTTCSEYYERMGIEKRKIDKENKIVNESISFMKFPSVDKLEPGNPKNQIKIEREYAEANLCAVEPHSELLPELPVCSEPSKFNKGNSENVLSWSASLNNVVVPPTIDERTVTVESSLQTNTVGHKKVSEIGCRVLNSNQKTEEKSLDATDQSNIIRPQNLSNSITAAKIIDNVEKLQKTLHVDSKYGSVNTTLQIGTKKIENSEPGVDNHIALSIADPFQSSNDGNIATIADITPEFLIDGILKTDVGQEKHAEKCFLNSGSNDRMTNAEKIAPHEVGSTLLNFNRCKTEIETFEISTTELKSQKIISLKGSDDISLEYVKHNTEIIVADSKRSIAEIISTFDETATAEIIATEAEKNTERMNTLEAEEHAAEIIASETALIATKKLASETEIKDSNIEATGNGKTPAILVLAKTKQTKPEFVLSDAENNLGELLLTKSEGNTNLSLESESRENYAVLSVPETDRIILETEGQKNTTQGNTSVTERILGEKIIFDAERNTAEIVSAPERDSEIRENVEIVVTTTESSAAEVVVSGTESNAAEIVTSQTDKNCSEIISAKTQKIATEKITLQIETNVVEITSENTNNYTETVFSVTEKNNAKIIAPDNENTANIISSDNENTAKIISSDNENTEKLISSDNENTEKIISSDNENTAKIIASENENTAKIIASENENTSKIISSDDENTAKIITSESENNAETAPSVIANDSEHTVVSKIGIPITILNTSATEKNVSTDNISLNAGESVIDDKRSDLAIEGNIKKGSINMFEITMEKSRDLPQKELQTGIPVESVFNTNICGEKGNLSDTTSSAVNKDNGISRRETSVSTSSKAKLNTKFKRPPFVKRNISGQDSFPCIEIFEKSPTPHTTVETISSNITLNKNYLDTNLTEDRPILKNELGDVKITVLQSSQNDDEFRYEDICSNEILNNNTKSEGANQSVIAKDSETTLLGELNGNLTLNKFSPIPTYVPDIVVNDQRFSGQNKEILGDSFLKEDLTGLQAKSKNFLVPLFESQKLHDPMKKSRKDKVDFSPTKSLQTTSEDLKNISNEVGGRTRIQEIQLPTESGSGINSTKESTRTNSKTPSSVFVGHLGSQSCVAPVLSENRGHIMSPSLSNNYIAMNGIDTQALEALAAQEELYLHQLQEKENLIVHLQANLEEIKQKFEGEANYSRVLAEYEKTLSLYIQQIDELKQGLEQADAEKLALIKERDQAMEDLRNVESAFSDVHRKYERAKNLLENLRINEEVLIRRDREMMMKVHNRERKMETLKEKVQDNLEKMHQDFETKLRESEADNARLRAQFRMMEMKLNTLENDVEQKAKENAQLSALCDELINGQVIN